MTSELFRSFKSKLCLQTYQDRLIPRMWWVSWRFVVRQTGGQSRFLGEFRTLRKLARTSWSDRARLKPAKLPHHLFRLFYAPTVFQSYFCTFFLGNWLLDFNEDFNASLGPCFFSSCRVQFLSQIGTTPALLKLSIKRSVTMKYQIVFKSV